MKKKRVLLMVRSGPYGSVFAAEALRAGIAFAGMDLDASIVFAEDGVFCLAKNQKPELAGMTGLSEGFENAGEFGLKIFAERGSLKDRGLRKDDIAKAQVVEDDDIRKMIEESDAVIGF